MKTAEEMYKFARQHKLGFNWLPFIQKKHFELIEKSLLPDEVALVSFIGRHNDENNTLGKMYDDEDDYNRRTNNQRNDRNMGNTKYFDCTGFHAYAITSEGRLIYANWKPFKTDTTSIPLNNINNINPNTKLIWGSVRIETFRDNFSVFWTTATIKRITKIIQKGISDNRKGKLGKEDSFFGEAVDYSEEQPSKPKPEQNAYLKSGRVGENQSENEVKLKLRLKELKEYYDEGYIDMEEYKKKKEDLLRNL